MLKEQWEIEILNDIKNRKKKNSEKLRTLRD